MIDPKQRALRDAERAADRKVALYRDIAVAVAIVAPLLWFLTPIGVIALIIFGIRLGKRYFSLMVAPELRKKFVEEEVAKRVDESVTRQRRDMQGRHARSLEQLSASIAHEIRNPITAAKSLVQQMGEEPAAAENVQYARVALEELERVEKSISHLWAMISDKVLLGYICFWMFDSEIQIINIAVHPIKRGRHLGQVMLTNMIKSGVSHGMRSVWLEVRPSNLPARALYAKLGFNEIGRRPGYYPETNEDAIIMSLELSRHSKRKGDAFLGFKEEASIVQA
jgi:ribosomal-protein-alanine N-acetyltransferase